MEKSAVSMSNPDDLNDAVASSLRRCGYSKSLAEGRQVHAHLARIGSDRETFLGNLLVQMYGNCGSLEDASSVFRRIRWRNVFSWNIMLTAYAQNGHLQEARMLFDEMPQRNVVSWNAMLTAYTQSGRLQEARVVFEKMACRNDASWNAMISGYAQNGDGSEALQMFWKMAIEGVQPDKITFVSALDGCAMVGALEQGKIIHAHIVSKGFQDDVIVSTALVNMYGKCRSLENAKTVFDSTHQRDVILWTAMISAYAQNGHLLEARSVFDRMPERNDISWTTMVTAYAQSAHVVEARDMLEKMPHRNLVAWTAVVAAYARNGYGKEAVKLFAEMDLEGVQPESITLISIFDACANVTTLAEGKTIHAHITESGFPLDLGVQTCMLTMYGKCGSLEDAKGIFDSMRQRDLLSWTSMITAYALYGHGREGLELFRSMEHEGIQPDEITFVSLLSACSRAGLLDDGLEYFGAMVGDYNIEPLKEHYTCLIDLLGKLGQLHEAEDLINSMPFKRDTLELRTLLGACRVHGDMKRGARVAGSAIQLYPKNDALYVLLSNMYAAVDPYL